MRGGDGVRGEHTVGCPERSSETLTQRRVSGVDSTDRNSPHPQPLSRAGARGADNCDCGCVQDRHSNLQRSIGSVSRQRVFRGREETETGGRVGTVKEKRTKLSRALRSASCFGFFDSLVSSGSHPGQIMKDSIEMAEISKAERVSDLLN